MFDENKFLTNCLAVAFDEIFRWRKSPAIQYVEESRYALELCVCTRVCVHARLCVSVSESMPYVAKDKTQSL